jgi:6,7-dimethyl-8-ribityllumazine synthase
MPEIIQGDLSAPRGRFAIVVSRFNEAITKKLLVGAVQTLTSRGVSDGAIEICWVPGAWEIPLIAQRLAESERFAAVLCLGAVIHGETTHDEHINRAVSLALTEITLRTGTPVSFGVLTCNSVEQAIHRSGGGMGNKGVETAQAAIEMVNLLERLPGGEREERIASRIIEAELRSGAEEA